jgi:hypothetical protein
MEGYNREKTNNILKVKPIKIAAEFSTEILKARKAWSDEFWAVNENNFIPRIFYPAKLSFKIDRTKKSSTINRN